MPGVAWLIAFFVLSVYAVMAVAFGTVDSFLIWRLTGGAVHATDATNASRTLLFNIHTLHWDDELLSYFGVPRAARPRISLSTSLGFGGCNA